MIIEHLMCNLRSLDIRIKLGWGMSWETLKPRIYDKWKQYWYDTHPADIAEYSWNYLFTGGKEIRARLFCELWQYLSPDSDVCAELAFAIECIHATSLILDDTPWMDNAAERRGKTTLHLVFTQKKAILLAHDVMYMVYLIWNESRPSHVPISVWEDFMKDKLQRLMIGQWYDLERTGRLTDLASLKTGVLFELVTETVAVCTNLDREFWKIWGNHLGILFQWMDDWQDREEDTMIQNRNAFNEAYDSTLTMYYQIWKKLEQGIGARWFHLPFGQFMRAYFTKDIPLPLSTSESNTLSGLFLPYPTHQLPYLQTILPEITEMEQQNLFQILHNRQNIVTINGINIFELQREDIYRILLQKGHIITMVNKKKLVEMNLQDIFILDLMEIINLFNESQMIKLNGKQLIRTMLKVTHRLHPHKEVLLQQYQPIYDSLRLRLWSIPEEEWELQPEVIELIYTELQQLKDQSGLVYDITYTD